MTREAPRRARSRGDWVVAVFGALIVALAVVGYRVAVSVQEDREAFERCVAEIPGYLDAEEIVYQERECEQGVSPRSRSVR